MTVGLDTTGKITIDGSGSTNPITVNAASGSAAFTVVAGSTAEIDGLTIGGAVTTAGTLTLNGDINPTANNFSVEALDGGTLYVPTSITLASLTIDAGGFAQQTSTDTTFGSEALTVGALTIDDSSGTTNGRVLDLGNGDLIVRDTDSSGIQPLLAAGYDGGAWDGEAASGPNPAAIVSSAAANDPYQIEALGYAEIGTDTGDLTLSSYDGQSVNTGDAVVALTYYGDANLDRQVNSTDDSMIGAQYPYTGVEIGGWTGGDFTYSGAVTLADFNSYSNTLLVLDGNGQNKGETSATQTTDTSKSATVVVKGVKTATGAQAAQGSSFTVQSSTNPPGVNTGPSVINAPSADASGNVTVQLAIGGLATGTYTVELADSDGTSITVTLTITQPQQ
jgi:hypothetical protein